MNDARGDTCAIEAAVPLVCRRQRGQPFVYATNHYAEESLKEADRRTPENKPVSIYRFGYLKWIEAFSPPDTIVDIETILASHEPWAPCRHGGPHRSWTLWSIVAIPARCCLRVASGAPCANAYIDYNL